MAEDVSLIADLDALEVTRGPQPMTCMWWAQADQATRDAVIRNVERVGHTLVFKKLRSRAAKVTTNGIRDHAAGKCDKCQTSPTN